MSQKGQLKLDKFFKVKSNDVFNIKVVKKKKLNLSLSKKPMESPKLSPKDLNLPEVVDLISDDENEGAVELNCSATSNTSNTTVEYNVEKNTPPGPSKFLTPVSKKKFYSPTKKNTVAIRSQVKAKRNLNLSLGSDDCKDEEFIEMTKGLDDNTIFLMRIIFELLNDRNLQRLMSEKSLNFFEKIIKATPPGKRIVCRLYWKVEQWCKWKKIKDNACRNKTNIDDQTVQVALNYLIEHGFIAVAQFNGQKHELGFDELVKIMYAEELLEICSGLKIKAKTKEVAIKLLRDFMCKKTNITNYFQGGKSNNQTRLINILGAKVGKCYKLASQAREALNELHILMYLGMDYSIIRDRKLELTLLNEKSKRETYPIDSTLVENASVIFKNRQEFERYLYSFSIHEEFLATTDLTERCRLIETVFGIFKAIPKEEVISYSTLPVWLRRFTPPHIYVGILEEGIKSMDLRKKTSNASLVNDILIALIGQDVFKQHKKAKWIAERALILDKYLGDSEQAAQVLIQGFKLDLTTEAEQLLYPRALRLANRKTNAIDAKSALLLRRHAQASATWEKEIAARHIYKVHMDNYSKGKLMFVEFINGTRTVMNAEEYCIYDYVNVESTYTHGGHWEGRIVTTLFFLLFWDIIYAPVSGICGLFLSRYQSQPLDLFTDKFYANRKLRIDNRLKEIEESTEADVLARMQATWLSRPETDVSKGIHRNIGWDDISAVAACLGPCRVAVLCRRLATKYHYAHSGFPDLTLWNVHTKQIVFVEVKTDSDKPSVKQKQWMHYLKENKINVEFCYIGVHTKRTGSRNCGEIEYVDDVD